MENNIQKEDLLALVKSKIYTIRGQKVMLEFAITKCDRNIDEQETIYSLCVHSIWCGYTISWQPGTTEVAENGIFSTRNNNLGPIQVLEELFAHELLSITL